MHRILIVEDNEMNRDALSRRLKSRGFAVRMAVDGFQALAMTAAEPPDLILMDLGLPEMDGCECVRRLRLDGLATTTPVIALTAHAMAGDRERAIAAGCDDFDTKPIDFPGLLLKIAALLPPAAPSTTS